LALFQKNRLARNVSWLLFGQGSNFLLQAAYFVLLARLLGVYEYGIFAAVFAMVNILTPYSTLGSGMLFMRYVSADRASAGVYWGNAMLVTFLATAFVGLALFFAGPLLVKSSTPTLILELVFANCLFSQISIVAGKVFQTLERMQLTALVALSSSLARLIVLLIVGIHVQGLSFLHLAAHSDSPGLYVTAAQWSLGVLIASGVTAAIAMVLVRRTIGPTRYSPRLLISKSLEGFEFSFAGTTTSVYNDVDKLMLGHYGMERENGFYTLAYRVVDFATTPIGAIDAAVLPRFFYLYEGGLLPVIRLAAKSVKTSFIFAAAIGAALWLIAPVIPHVVGQDFSTAVTALRWLCWLPVLRSVHLVTGSALTSIGKQNMRTASQFSAAAVNVALNFWWIPTIGWIGAAWSSVLCDGLLGILNAGLLIWVWKTSRHVREQAGNTERG
jgi:O-antigen/teichoic acid export membrane protein